MKTCVTYDLMESARRSNEILGAAFKAYWSSPFFEPMPHLAPAQLASWGAITEQSFRRIDQKPDWGIDKTITKGREYGVEKICAVDKPFANSLILMSKSAPHRHEKCC